MSNENEFECRLCREDLNFENPVILDQILAPCRCTGSMAFIHIKCLQDWGKNSCEICGFHFTPGLIQSPSQSSPNISQHPLFQVDPSHQPPLKSWQPNNDFLAQILNALPPDHIHIDEFPIKATVQDLFKLLYHPNRSANSHEIIKAWWIWLTRSNRWTGSSSWKISLGGLMLGSLCVLTMTMSIPIKVYYRFQDFLEYYLISLSYNTRTIIRKSTKVIGLITGIYALNFFLRDIFPKNWRIFGMVCGFGITFLTEWRNIYLLQKKSQ